MLESERTWLEKVDEKLVDEFYYKLFRLSKEPLWNQAIEYRNDILLFFEYFESQIEKVKELKQKLLSSEIIWKLSA
jgi:hypothetical protein